MYTYLSLSTDIYLSIYISIYLSLSIYIYSYIVSVSGVLFSVGVCVCVTC